MNKIVCLLLLAITHLVAAQPQPAHNLVFDSMAARWDEGIPLGNGWLGALIWKKENRIRLSLDRVDLWDDRPMPEIDKLSFTWVVEKVQQNQYDSVQKRGDEPYEKYAAPTKIPGAAMEFDCSAFGKVVYNELDIRTALSTIQFENGVRFFNYVHASKETGYFGFENLPSAGFSPALIVPAYNTGNAGVAGNRFYESSIQTGDTIGLLLTFIDSQNNKELKSKQGRGKGTKGVEAPRIRLIFYHNGLCLGLGYDRQ